MKKFIGPLFLNFSFSLCLFSVTISVATRFHRAVAQNRELGLTPNDLAIVLSTFVEPPIMLSSATGPVLLSKNQYKTLSQAYQNTSVGDVWESESTYDDFRVVSMRIDPCAPIVVGRDQNPAEYCWPEVRVVVVPVLKELLRGNRWIKNWADDRSLHLIFPVASDVAINKVILEIQEKAKSGKLVSLNGEVKSQFQNSRNLASLRVISAAKGLSLESQPKSGISVRPEVQSDLNKNGLFRSRLITFLKEFAAPDQLAKVTAFSLPEGRNPSPSDDWVFLSFKNSSGKLNPSNIVIHHESTGVPLVTLDHEESASFGRDDPRIYDQLENSAFPEQIKKQIMLFRNNDAFFKSTINDSNKILVPNTSCASCHKLNKENIDFHNFSNFLDNEFVVSERVKTDVKNNLDWVKRYLE